MVSPVPSARPSLLVAIASLMLSLGCSSDPGAPVVPETVASPTTPTPADPNAPAGTTPAPIDAPVSHATLAMSPACGAVGERVMLRLDWTADRRVPDCLRAEDFQVRFGPKPASITKLGKMNEGWCALDVLVPKGAASAVVTVTVGHDVYESPTAFATPCP